jgi:hypothetical protein
LLILACALLAATAILPGTAGAGSSRDRATGGGQSFLDSRDAKGAGDTVAFTAQRARGAEDGSDAATGQVQVNRRGDNAVKFHGTITCLVVNGGNSTGYAYMSGTARNGKPFELYVSDGGKGQDERNDAIMLFYDGETTSNDDDNEDGPCGFDEEPDTVNLARGNVQTYNANTSEDADPESSSTALTAPLSSLLK